MERLSVKIGIVLIAITAAMAYLVIFKEIEDKIYLYIMGASFIALSILYLSQYRLDWWWYVNRKPPQMPVGLEKQLQVMVPFYKGLDPIEKKRFRDRTMLWSLGREFIPISMETVQEDIQNLISAHVVMMTFGIEKYLLNPFERVVVYPHAFPSPNYKVLHSSEINMEDGVTIFDLERLLMGAANPVKFYNLILHEYARAFMEVHKDIDFPEFPEEKWETLATMRGFDKKFIETFVGLDNVDPKQMAIEHFFVTPKRFHHFFPEEYQRFTEIFNMDLLKKDKPVIQIRKIGINPIIGE